MMATSREVHKKLGILGHKSGRSAKLLYTMAVNKSTTDEGEGPRLSTLPYSREVCGSGRRHCERLATIPECCFASLEPDKTSSSVAALEFSRCQPSIVGRVADVRTHTQAQNCVQGRDKYGHIGNVTETTDASGLKEMGRKRQDCRKQNGTLDQAPAKDPHKDKHKNEDLDYMLTTKEMDDDAHRSQTHIETHLKPGVDLKKAAISNTEARLSKAEYPTKKHIQPKPNEQAETNARRCVSQPEAQGSIFGIKNSKDKCRRPMACGLTRNLQLTSPEDLSAGIYPSSARSGGPSPQSYAAILAAAIKKRLQLSIVSHTKRERRGASAKKSQGVDEGQMCQGYWKKKEAIETKYRHLFDALHIEEKSQIALISHKASACATHKPLNLAEELSAVHNEYEYLTQLLLKQKLMELEEVLNTCTIELPGLETAPCP